MFIWFLKNFANSILKMIQQYFKMSSKTEDLHSFGNRDLSIKVACCSSSNIAVNKVLLNFQLFMISYKCLMNKLQR